MIHSPKHFPFICDSFTCREDWQDQLKELIVKLNISVAFDAIAGDMSGTMMQVANHFKRFFILSTSKFFLTFFNDSASSRGKHHRCVRRPVRQTGNWRFLLLYIFSKYFVFLSYLYLGDHHHDTKQRNIGEWPSGDRYDLWTEEV